MHTVSIPIIRKRKFRSSKNSDRYIYQKIAHRGAAGYCPENTFAAFDRAIEMGADYIEIDLQFTKDNKIVVIHDLTVDRTTNGKGKVIDYTMEELQQLDAGSWFDPEFAGEKIPTFSEVLEIYGMKIGLLIELKKPSVNPGIEEAVAAEMKKMFPSTLPADHFIIQSFEQASLKKIKPLLPNIPIGVLVNFPLTKQEIHEISLFADYLNPKWTLVNEALIRQLQANNLKSFAWTIRNSRDLERLKQYPVDGIATDYLDLLE